MYFHAMQIKNISFFIFIQETNKELFLLTHKTNLARTPTLCVKVRYPLFPEYFHIHDKADLIMTFKYTTWNTTLFLHLSKVPPF